MFMLVYMQDMTKHDVMQLIGGCRLTQSRTNTQRWVAPRNMRHVHDYEGLYAFLGTEGQLQMQCISDAAVSKWQRES
jgi:hypothetical protein